MKKKYFLMLFVYVYLFTNEKFILMTTLYEEKKEERQAEFLTCLKKNLNNHYIEKIIVLFEKNKEGNFFEKIKDINFEFPDKLDLIFVYERPKYCDFFIIANEHYKERKIVLANADIFFDSTLSLIHHRDLENVFMAITRWDKTDKGFVLYPDHGSFLIGSQDTWVFLSPIRNFFSDIYLGYLCCDQAIAYFAYKAGLKVVNPCLSVKSYHVHLSNIRTYSTNNSYFKVFPRLGLKPCYMEAHQKYKPNQLVKRLRD